MAIIEGQLEAASGRFAIVASKFNREIVDKLVAGALAGFQQNQVNSNRIDLFWVPGAFEIPLVAQNLADHLDHYVAILGLGAVIRGDTDHYDFVARAAADGILQAGLNTGVPVIFGVLTCATEEQALARAGGEHGNKGYDAALTAIEMANLLQIQLPEFCDNPANPRDETA